MTIELGMPVLYGALVGLCAAMILKLVAGIVSHFISFGGLGSVGEELSVSSYLHNLGKPALVFMLVGTAIGLFIANV